MNRGRTAVGRLAGTRTNWDNGPVSQPKVQQLMTSRATVPPIGKKRALGKETERDIPGVNPRLNPSAIG
jgi:hypothetical protein